MEKPEKKVERVTTGEIKPKKSFARSFLAEDLAQVKDYILSSVVVPNIQRAVIDTVRNGIEMLFYGEVRNTPTSASVTGSKVTYNKMYDVSGRSQSQTYIIQDANDKRIDYTELTFDSELKAKEVLYVLNSHIETYGLCSIAQLYEILDHPRWSTHTDQNYGWMSLTGATIERTFGGRWWLKLPKAMPII